MASQADAVPAARRAVVVRAFKQAWEAKDIDALLGLLAPDATATGDGGGLVTAALDPVRGAEQVARFFADRADGAAAVTLVERTVNGQPGLVAQLAGATVSVMAFDVTGDRISRIWAVLNPEKLRSWTTGRQPLDEGASSADDPGPSWWAIGDRFVSRVR
ncbi:hypothetical protein JCM4914_68790 [Streptomyces platensis subsp. malvinus]